MDYHKPSNNLILNKRRMLKCAAKRHLKLKSLEIIIISRFSAKKQHLSLHHSNACIRRISYINVSSAAS